MWVENHLEGAIGSIGVPLNYNPQTTSYVRFAASNTAGGYASKHTRGGVNILLLDGSVRFLENSVSDQIRLALGTIAGQEAFNLP